MKWKLLVRLSYFPLIKLRKLQVLFTGNIEEMLLTLLFISAKVHVWFVRGCSLKLWPMTYELLPVFQVAVDQNHNSDLYNRQYWRWSA